MRGYVVSVRRGRLVLEEAEGSNVVCPRRPSLAEATHRVVA